MRHKRLLSTSILLIGLQIAAVATAGNLYSHKPGANIRLNPPSMVVDESDTLPVSFKMAANIGLVDIVLRRSEGLSLPGKQRRWTFQGENLAPTLQLPVALQGNRGLISFYIRTWENIEPGMSEASVRAQMRPSKRVLTLVVHSASKNEKMASRMKTTIESNERIQVLPDGSRRHILPASEPQK